MQTIVNLGSAGSLLNGRNGSTTSADSNDALFLDWPGDNSGNYVYLPGVAGNYLSVPDQAALDITGDIDIRAQVALDDWTSTNQSLVSKWLATGNQRSFDFRVSASGFLQFIWATDGITGFSRTSTTALTTSDEAVVWVRAVLDVNNGAAGHDVLFYTSDDGLTWVQLGTTVTTAGTTSIYSGTSIVSVGHLSTNSQPSSGKYYRAQILNGIAGTTVLDVDTSRLTTGSATSFTAITGQTVTINRSTAGRKTVAVTASCWLFGTDDYMEVADNALIDFGSTDSFTVLVVVRQWDTPINTGRLVHKRDASSPNVGWVLGYNGTTIQPQGAIDDGPTLVTRNGSVKASGALSLFGFIVDRTAQTLATITDASISATSSISSVGSLITSLPMQIGRFGALYQDYEMLSVAVFRRVLTETEVSLINDYYTARWA